MPKLKQPKQLLKIISKQKAKAIYVTENGNWVIDNEPMDYAISLTGDQLICNNKLEALCWVRFLNVRLHEMDYIKNSDLNDDEKENLEKEWFEENDSNDNIEWGTLETSLDDGTLYDELNNFKASLSEKLDGLFIQYTYGFGTDPDFYNAEPSFPFLGMDFCFYVPKEDNFDSPEYYVGAEHIDFISENLKRLEALARKEYKEITLEELKDYFYKEFKVKI